MAKKKKKTKKKASSTVRRTKTTKASGSTSACGVNLDELEKLVDHMKNLGVSELEWARKDQKIRVNTQAGAAPVALASPVAAQSLAPAVSPAVGGSSAATADPVRSASPTGKEITSPFVGTFYRASSPGADSFVKEGQMIKRGDTLCIIEAMKLMNEIEAEVAGKVVSVLVENGQPVEYGEPLFVVEPA